jgi:molybdate transport system regulatory protein
LNLKNQEIGVQPGFNLWIDVDGQVALSGWRVKLLKTIAATGSINAAAREMDIPYQTTGRRFTRWMKRLGVKLLETRIGGEHGGGAQLSPRSKGIFGKDGCVLCRLTPVVEKDFPTHF